VRLTRPAADPVPVVVISASPSRIEGVVPRDARLGPANLIVVTRDGESAPFAVNIVRAQPGLFSAGGTGWGQGEIAQPDGTNSISHSARPGEVVRFRATGFARGSGKTQLFVGGKSVSAVVIPKAEGIEEIRLRIPDDSPQGCVVPVYAREPGAPRSNVVSMAVESKGGPCRLNDGTSIGTVQRYGMVALMRTEMRYEAGRVGTTLDEAEGVFADYSKTRQPFGVLVLPPPPGTCTSYTSSADAELSQFTSLPGLIGGNVGSAGLNAGPELTLDGPQGSRQIPAAKGARGVYWARLGLEEAGTPRRLPLFLSPGEYRVSSAGAETGSFARPIGIPAPVEWLNRGRVLTIDRATGLTVEWRAGPPDTWVALIAANIDRLSTAMALTFCGAHAEAGRLTVPAEMLSYIPPSRDQMGRLRSVLALVTVQVREGIPPDVSGLERLWLTGMHIDAQRVTYR